MKKYRNKNLSNFDSYRDKYWTQRADQFLRYKELMEKK